MFVVISRIGDYFVFDKVVRVLGKLNPEAFLEHVELGVFQFVHLEGLPMTADFSVFDFGLKRCVVLALLPSRLLTRLVLF